MIMFVVISFILVVMLRWFCDDEILKPALNGELIEEECVERQPEVVPNTVLDENVDGFLKFSLMMPAGNSCSMKE